MSHAPKICSSSIQIAAHIRSSYIWLQIQLIYKEANHFDKAPRSNFAEIFGVRELECLGYRAALSTWSDI